MDLPFLARAAGREDMKPVYGDHQPGDVGKTLGGTAYAGDLLGFEAEIGLEKGLEETAAFLSGDRTS